MNASQMSCVLWFEGRLDFLCAEVNCVSVCEIFVPNKSMTLQATHHKHGPYYTNTIFVWFCMASRQISYISFEPLFNRKSREEL